MVAVRHHDDRHTAQLCEPLGKWTLSTAQLLLKMGQAPAPEWKIPELVGVKIRETEFQPRQPRNFPSPLDPAREAVEIVITLKSLPPRRCFTSEQSSSPNPKPWTKKG